MLLRNIQNTAVGFTALSSDTLGSQSTAVGYQALFSQNFTTATDTHNTAVGYNAGSSMLLGSANTICGSAALDAETKGHHSVAVGYSALTTQNFTTSTDAFNTAVGSLAGEANATGVSNTFIGGN